MTEKFEPALPNNDGDKGFAGFSSWVSDVSKDIEQLSRQKSPENELASRSIQVLRHSKKPSGKFYVGVVAGAFFIAWLSGAFNGKNHLAENGSAPHQSNFGSVTAKSFGSVGGINNSGSSDATARSDSEIAEQLAKRFNYDLAGARKKGYTDQQIINHLSSIQSGGEPLPKQGFIPNDVLVVPNIDTIGKAPNGQDWPANSGYLRGYKKLNSGGLSSLTIDNTSNDSNVYLKLFSLNDSPPTAVRHVYIKAGDKFTFRSVKAGNYDVRYRDLRYGGISKTDAFELQETNDDSGTTYSEMTMTLYKVRNGNMHTKGISEAEF